MPNILLRSYPLESTKNRGVTAIAISIFVYFFLLIFEPFQLNLLEGPNKSLIIGGYGAICLGSLLIFYVVLPWSLSSVFREERWQVLKEIFLLLLNVVIIGFVLAVYEQLIGTRQIGWFSIAETIGKVLLIGIFPITGLVVLNQVRLLRKHLNRAEAGNLRLAESPKPQEAIPIQLESENKKESFEALFSEILFIAALGNYVEIFQVKEKTILRTTLDSVDDQLLDHPSMFRCHRAYLVNINHVNRIEGNARGLELHLNHTDRSVPVSRRKTGDFQQLIGSLGN